MRRPDAVLAAVGLGSNLENPSAQVRNALADLRHVPHTSLLASSPLYRSTAVGPDGQPVAQPDFCNAAALLETYLSASELLEALHQIEGAHGRIREQRWTARTLDLDLLVYGNEIHAEPGLTVPHPRIAGRNFVLYPLRDIAPALDIPQLGRAGELAAQLDAQGLTAWHD